MLGLEGIGILEWVKSYIHLEGLEGTIQAKGIAPEDTTVEDYGMESVDLQVS